MSAEVRPLPSRPALDAVRELFAGRPASGAAPSVSYGVIAGGRLIDSGGFGDLDGSGVVPNADSAYRIASVTKSFTAAALVLLRDRRLLSLDAPITELVPALAELRLPTADSPPPTLRMLATMSAGLPNDDPWADRQEPLTDDQFDAVLRAGIRFAWVPGTAFEYSNLGYALLGRAIQVASGRRYHDFVADELLAPLGMAATGFTADVAASGGVAVGFDKVGEAWAPVPFSGPGAFSAIGGLFSTVADLARWVQWFVDAHAGDDDGPLSAASRREMQQAYRLMPPDPADAATSRSIAGYGFGLVVEHDPDHRTIVSHSGGYPGFGSHMRWHPATGVGVVVLENATYASPSKPAGVALRELLASLDSGPAWRPWTETLAAQAHITRMLVEWDGSLAGSLFSENVALDMSLERRRQAIEAALAEAGPLGEVVDEQGGGPNERVWRIRGEHADLHCELTMNPQDPPRVQSLEVRVDRQDRT